MPSSKITVYSKLVNCQLCTKKMGVPAVYREGKRAIKKWKDIPIEKQNEIYNDWLNNKNNSSTFLSKKYNEPTHHILAIVNSRISKR